MAVTISQSALHSDVIVTTADFCHGRLTSQGAENLALNLHVVNSSFATATVPRLVGATSFARADVSLTDVSGRAAFLWQAFEYQPGWEPYALTVGLFAFLALLGCFLVPAFVRAGCEGSAWREKVVWKTISKEKEMRLYAKAQKLPVASETTGRDATSESAASTTGVPDSLGTSIMNFLIGGRPASANTQRDLV